MESEQHFLAVQRAITEHELKQSTRNSTPTVHLIHSRREQNAVHQQSTLKKRQNRDIYKATSRLSKSDIISTQRSHRSRMNLVAAKLSEIQDEKIGNKRIKSRRKLVSIIV